MKVLAIIPARGGSKGCVDKNIRLLNGKPTVAHTIEMAQKAKLVDDVVVSSDSPEIILCATGYGVEAIKRPKSLATDKSPIEDALIHAVIQLRKQHRDYDIVLWLQADCPIRQENVIDESIEKLVKNPQFDSIVTISEAKYPIEWAQRIIGETLEPAAITYVYTRQQAQTRYFLDGSVHAIRTATLTEIGTDPKLHHFLGRMGYIEQEFPYCLSIDTEWDFFLAEKILERLSLKGE